MIVARNLNPDWRLSRFRKTLTQTASKTVSQAPTAEQGLENLAVVEKTWASRYPQALQSWRAKWALLSPYFDYPAAVRKVMYTAAADRHQHSGRLPPAVTQGDEDKTGRPGPGLFPRIWPCRNWSRNSCRSNACHSKSQGD